MGLRFPAAACRLRHRNGDAPPAIQIEIGIGIEIAIGIVPPPDSDPDADFDSDFEGNTLRGGHRIADAPADAQMQTQNRRRKTILET